ncbi:MAG: ferredoxin--nitrite reductase [Chloroflexota bacterium]|nr:ferredoxin--nitrite reductase [Chloroflexota bacterium]
MTDLMVKERLPIAPAGSADKANKTPLEAIKAAKDGLDVLPDIYRYAREGFAAIPAEDYERMKWYGLFHRKQTPGYFMMRLRLPNGIVTSDQLRAIASISREAGRGAADLTTRQNIQLRWIEIENVPAIFERLNEVGLTSQQTGLDNYRNIMGCPIAGLDDDEAFDASHMARAVSLALLGYEFSNLPRKFNISISGCRHDCGHSRANDIGLTPARKLINGFAVDGFHVALGGALGGTWPQLGQPLDVFLRTEQALPFCRAAMTVFRDHGSREKRTEARLKWLLKEWGIERFVAAVEREMGQTLMRGGESALVVHDGDHLGVHQQKQAGFSYVGLHVPVGRTNAEQLAQLADLAEAYGTGEVRLTNDQNVIIPNVHESILPNLLAEPLLAALQPNPPGALRGLSSCTGKDFCHFALNDTKGLSLQIGEELAQLLPDHSRIDLKVSGCVHACGQHHIGQIGLQAQRIRLASGEIVDGFDLFVGGNHHQLAALKEQKVPMTEIARRIAEEVMLMEQVEGHA